MDLSQTLLLIIIVVISVILTVIGIQVIIILRDAKHSLRRVDNILEDTEYLTRNLTRSSATFAHLTEGLKSGMQLVSTITEIVSSKSKSKKSK